MSNPFGRHAGLFAGCVASRTRRTTQGIRRNNLNAGLVSCIFINMEPKTRHPLLNWTRTELWFFFIFFFLFHFVQDIQYLNHPDIFPQNRNTVLYSFIGDLYTVIPYALYYKLLTPLLLRKKIVRFTLLLILGIFAFDWYNRLMDWCVANASFLPDQVRGFGARGLKDLRIFGRQSVLLTLQRLLCVTALAYWKQSRDQQDHLNYLRQEQLRLQLDNLKAQLQPHFFFNTLNNIYSLAVKNSAATAGTIAQLSDLMRYVLNHTSDKLVSLKGETGFLGNYIALERIRHRDPEQVRFHVQGNTEGLMIPPLLFLPFVENAFKHGLETGTDSFAEILVIYADGQLTLHVKNSYGSSPDLTGYKGGLGISNARQRLELIYPAQHEISISDSNGIFSVTLNIQLRPE